ATTVHWLSWTDFVPTSDKVLREQIVPAAAKDLGVTLNIEMINGNDIQARTTAAIQSGTGPDVICALNNWPQLYADSVAPVDDVAEKLGKDQGGFYKESIAVANNGKKWIGVPCAFLASRTPIANRGLRQSASPSFRRLGTSTATPAKSLRPRASRSARRSVTASAIRRRSSIPISGRGAARKWRKTAKPSRSIAKRRSSR